MAPDRRSRRGRGGLRWGRGYYGVRVEYNHVDDTIAGEPCRRVLDSYCPFCATDIRSVGPRRLVRCPNVAICGKLLPLDDSTCPNCCHYTRTGDNFCRVCRTNLRGVVRGHGGLYQQLNRAPSPIQIVAPAMEDPEPASHDDDSSDDEGNAAPRLPNDIIDPQNLPGLAEYVRALQMDIPVVVDPPRVVSRQVLRQFERLRDLNG